MKRAKWHSFVPIIFEIAAVLTGARKPHDIVYLCDEALLLDS